MSFFDLDTMREQDAIMQCPYCFNDLKIEDVVGECTYDKSFSKDEIDEKYCPDCGNSFF